MKRLRRPSLSDSLTKNSAPTTSPARYTLPTTPTATTILVWNGDQGSRSRRAGIRLRTTPGAGVFAAVVIAASRFFFRDDHRGAFRPGSVVPPQGKVGVGHGDYLPCETERVPARPGMM